MKTRETVSPGAVCVRFSCDAEGCGAYILAGDGDEATDAFRWSAAGFHYGWSGDLAGPHYCRAHNERSEADGE